MASFFENMLGMEVSDTMALVFAVIGVLLLLAIIWLLVRIFRQPRFAGRRGKQARLAITDAARIDDRRRLVLVRRDDVEHLIMIGGVTDLLVETDIRRTSPARGRNVAEEQVQTPPPAPEPRQAPAAAPKPASPPAPAAAPAPSPAPAPAPKPAAGPVEAKSGNDWPAVPPSSKPAPAVEPRPTPVAAPTTPPSKDFSDPAATPPVVGAPAKRPVSEEMEALLSGLKPTR